MCIRDSYNKVVELSFDISVMDARSIALILYSRSQLKQDLEMSKEYKVLKSDYKETDWAQTVDRFHIQSEDIRKNLLEFIEGV